MGAMFLTKLFVCMSLFRRRSLPLRKENMVFMRRNDLIPYGSKPNLIKECIPVRYVLPAAVAAIRCTGVSVGVGGFSAWGGVSVREDFSLVGLCS